MFLNSVLVHLPTSEHFIIIQHKMHTQLTTGGGGQQAVFAAGSLREPDNLLKK